MVAIEHRKKSSTTTIVSVLSPTSSSTASTASPTETTSSSSAAGVGAGTDAGTSNLQPEVESCSKRSQNKTKMSRQESIEAAVSGAIAKSAVSQRSIDIKIANKTNVEAATQELTKKVLKLDLTGKELDEYSIKSPKSPIAARLPHQTSLTSSVDVEDRKTLREALYQGIFHRHRRTIFAVGSFLRMLRSRNSQYNTIRSSSEGEEVEEGR